MAGDYSYNLRPPCKSRSTEFYSSRFDPTSSSATSSYDVVVTRPWPMSQTMSRFYLDTIDTNDAWYSGASAAVSNNNNNSYQSDDESSHPVYVPSFVVVAPTSCCYTPLMQPRVKKPMSAPSVPPGVSEPATAPTARNSSKSCNSNNKKCGQFGSLDSDGGCTGRFGARKKSLISSPIVCIPWLKRIRVFKRIQSKIGIGSRGGGPSVNNLPPLLFNAVHGENISITDNGTVARRVSSFCKAIVFSDRAVKVNEKVCLKFLEVSPNWSGVLRFGFTSNDPSTLRSCLPRYACPDLTSKPGFWAKAFSDVHVKKDTVLYYYVNSAGDVHFGINGEEKGIFFSGVDTRKPLWALIDVYGNTTALEFVDTRAHLNNLRRNTVDAVSQEIDTNLVPSLNDINIGGTPSGCSSSFGDKFPDIRYYPNTVRGSLIFHRTKGKHAEIGVFRCMAWRRSNEYANGYVFTATPILPGEGIVIQVLQNDPEFASSMAFGLTSCDPSAIQPSCLPDDSHYLLDRPEYWVVKKDAASGPIAGDELCFIITHSGEVMMSKNGGSSITLMYVDNSVPLWAFFDLYGTTTKVFLLGKVPAPARTEPRATAPQRTTTKPSSSVTNVPQTVMDRTNNFPSLTPSSTSRAAIPRSQSSTLPASIINRNLALYNVNGSACEAPQVPPNSAATTPSGAAASDVTASLRQSCSPSTMDLQNNWTVECVICCERQVDSVFYTCGHMCMCYQCATDYWKTKDKGWCPICRATITDVIRTYKS